MITVELGGDVPARGVHAIPIANGPEGRQPNSCKNHLELNSVKRATTGMLCRVSRTKPVRMPFVGKTPAVSGARSYSHHVRSVPAE